MLKASSRWIRLTEQRDDIQAVRLIGNDEEFACGGRLEVDCRTWMGLMAVELVAGLHRE